MMQTQNYVRERLLELSDEKYRDFQSSLMPTVNKNLIIGVRVPEQRKLAKELWESGAGKEYIEILPHKYYEEYNVHAFCIEQIRDFVSALSQTEELLPYIDNWATCDMFSPKIFSKHTDEIFEKSLEWIASGKTYTVRYGIGMLMRYFFDDKFCEDVLKIVADIRSDEYYINMMIAWFFATALAKQYDSSVGYIENRILDKWVHNKAIQKAVESCRITNETKIYLKSLKIK